MHRLRGFLTALRSKTRVAANRIALTDQRQRMPAIAERQLDGGLQAMRFVDGQDHLERRPGVVEVPLRLTIPLDRLHEIASDPDVALAEAAVLERLRLTQARRGDFLP